MNKLLYCVLVALCIGVCAGQTTNPCLYSSASAKVLSPLIMQPNVCPNNASYCMNVAYKYGNFQYNGQASLKPEKGEIVMFLARYPDALLSFHLVIMMNAAVTTTMNVSVQMTGTEPTGIELYDDPIGSTDSWQWDSSTNTGRFIWVTQPTYTDGCVIGPVTLMDNYCIKASFIQPNNAIQKISIMSGNSTSPQKVISAPYTSGSTFEFCQYPQTVTLKQDVTCPGLSNGAANVSIVFGPSNVNYTWKNSSGVIVGTGQSVAGLKAGIYNVYVTDTSSNNCNAVRSVTITEPSALTSSVITTPFACSVAGTANVTAMGGAGGYTYTWKLGASVIGMGPSIVGLVVGTYSVVVSDICGTTTTATLTISSTGCCGDGICQTNEMCGSASYCSADCPICCPAGTYTYNSTCIVCPAGSYSTTAGSTSCMSCPPNTYNAGANSTCTACPENTQSMNGSGVCINCAAGYIRPSNETSCRSCGAGMIPSCNSATCTPCMAGTFAADSWTKCQACPAGTYSTSGSASCTTCPANTYASSGAIACTSCPTGTSTSAGSSHRVACM